MSNLADVRDLDCVASFSPLAFDSSTREVTGAAAVLRRILYRWSTKRGSLPYALDKGLDRPITDLEGATFSQRGLDGYRVALEREAADEDFVLDAAVTFTVADSGIAKITAAIALVDGKSYPLAVDVTGAAAAILALGGSS